MAYDFDDMKDIDAIREEIRVSRKFSPDHRATRGNVARVVNLYHPKKIDMQVASIISASPGSKTIRLTPMGGYLPPFMAGQHINVKVNVNGVTTNRAYSISSSPNQRAYYEITVRSIENGFVSDYLLNELKVGDSLETSAPTGQFVYNPLIHGDRLVFIAGGCGITPFMSMVRNFHEKNNHNVKIELIYGCARNDDVLFRRELEELHDTFDRFDLHLVLSEPDDGYDGHTGFITADLISKLIGSLDGKRFFLCGPEEMYRLVVKELVSLGLDEHQIKREVQAPPADPTRLPGWPQDVTADTRVQIKVSGGPVIEASVMEPILNSLERHNIIVPATCRAGECSLCRIKLVTGNVYSPDSVRLRKADREYNYIHSCATYPVSDIEVRLQV
ncbi:MAG: hypothetical protein CMQ20_11910 [Gammaproteobacteria bacterium]|jgi:ferredoxin-NADP reductase|nr:hypothetical protein [Gammaproteobacteria bacterium]|tara:strand:- start:8223 stop:9386 length:1164 start_codon:yes stop_codon:yes gene_type:complete